MHAEIVSWLCVQEIAVINPHVYKGLIFLGEKVASVWVGSKNHKVLTSVFSEKNRVHHPQPANLFFVAAVVGFLRLLMFTYTYVP